MAVTFPNHLKQSRKGERLYFMEQVKTELYIFRTSILECGAWHSRKLHSMVLEVSTKFSLWQVIPLLPTKDFLTPFSEASDV